MTTIMDTILCFYDLNGTLFCEGRKDCENGCYWLESVLTNTEKSYELYQVKKIEYIAGEEIIHFYQQIVH